jgi:hypothetical protein
MTTQTCTLLVLIFIIIALVLQVYSVSAKLQQEQTTTRNIGLWKNCSTMITQDTNDGQYNNNTIYNGFGCSHVVYDSKPYNRYTSRKGKVDILFFTSNKYNEVCGESRWESITVPFDENGTRADNCYDYYCAQPMNDYIKKDPVYYTDAVNYCLYCKNNRNREQFVQSAASGTCLGLNEVIDMKKMSQHCSGKPYSVYNGIPMVEYENSDNSKIYFYCYCPALGVYSYRCNFNAVVESFVSYFQSPLISVSFSVLVLANIIFCTIPLIIHCRRVLLTNAYGLWYAIQELPIQRSLVHSLTMISMIVQIFGSVLHFTFAYIDEKPYRVIVSVYDASVVISEGCIFSALFTYLSVWINIMYKTQHLDTNSVPVLLKILPAPVYFVTIAECIGTVVVSIIFSANTNLGASWKYTLISIYMTWVVFMIIVWIGLGVYGIKLYRLLSAVQRVSPLNLKFTRILIAFSFIGLVHLAFRIYMISVNLAKYVAFPLIIRLKTTILAIILYALCMLMTTAVFHSKDLEIAYPFIGEWQRKIKDRYEDLKQKRSIDKELQEEFLSSDIE